MCDDRSCCQKPQFLQKDLLRCPPEQIKICHGDEQKSQSEKQQTPPSSQK